MRLKTTAALIVFLLSIPELAKCETNPIEYFGLVGYEQLYYGHFNIAFSRVNNKGWSQIMNTIHCSYSPWGHQSQFYYSFDYSGFGIGASANAGIVSDYKAASPFLRPELGLNLAQYRIMLGYNIPLYKQINSNTPVFTFKVYAGLFLNKKKAG